MKNNFSVPLVSLIVVLLAPQFIRAQNKVSPKELAHLNNSNLRSIQYLLLRWQTKTFIPESMTEEQWEQSIYVDEQSAEIIYKIRPATDEPTGDRWLATHHIPIHEIDSVTNHYSDHTLVLYTPYEKIDSYLFDDPAAKNEKVSMPMQLDKVRNLAGQLWTHIQKFQRSQ
ncbi:MAG: hypothetical protein JNM78_13215 [Cyclobacteriaceae bacterium]|nr:hypothetical protein [Cyclobacteriaceae bacterium]